VSKRLGRIGVAVCFKVVGVGLLLSLCFLSWDNGWRWALAAVYVMRTALMNSTQGGWQYTYSGSVQR
jgi:hypothetical protein